MKRILLTIVILATLATAAQAQVIGVTSKDNGSSQNTSTFKQKGSYLKFEVGTPISIAYNYRINPYIALGGGIGFQIPFLFIDADGGPLVFGEFTASTPLQRWGLFVDARSGVGMWSGQAYFYYGLSAGGSYKNFKLGVGVHNGIFVDMENYIEHGLMLYVSYSLPLRKLY